MEAGVFLSSIGQIGPDRHCMPKPVGRIGRPRGMGRPACGSVGEGAQDALCQTHQVARSLVERMLDRGKSCSEIDKPPLTVSNEAARHRFVTAAKPLAGAPAPNARNTPFDCQPYRLLQNKAYTSLFSLTRKLTKQA